MTQRYQLTTQAASVAKTPYPISVNHFIAITDDEQGIGIALKEKLNARNYHAEVVKTVPDFSDVVILLEGLCAFNSEEDAIAINQQAFNNAQIIADRFTHKGGLLITVQDTGGNFGLSNIAPLRAWAAGLSALAKTASQEWPKSVVRAIDMSRDNLSTDIIAERLFQEILNSCDDIECGLLTTGERITLKTELAPCKKNKFSFAKRPVIVVSGGARGITAACIIGLAKQLKARFVLLGRTELLDDPQHYQNYPDKEALRQFLFIDAQKKNLTIQPKQMNQQIADILARREIHQTLQALKNAGSDAIYFNVDVLNPKQLTTIFTQVRKQWGGIHALIHGAGMLFDKLIADQTPEQFDKVFNTKVLGLLYLLRETTNDPLQFIGLFSSVAARFGNPGQVAYAMANEVLNKVAQYESQQRHQKCLVKSFNWGPWEMGMVTPELKKLFLQRGISLLPIAEGVEMFVDELTTDHQDVELVFGSKLVPNPVSQKYTVDVVTEFLLANHVINDCQVLPACLVLDWFLRTQQQFTACKNFKVLRGIRVKPDENLSAEFTTHHEKNHVYLEDHAGYRCYSAEMDVTPEKNTLSSTTVFADAWPCNIKDIYSSNTQAGVLFHGPAFQVIRSLENFSDKGGTAHLAGIQMMDWPKDKWQIDVAALDGALQLLLLWGFYIFKQKTLPTSIGAVTKYTDDLPSGILQCIFHCEMRSNQRFLADVILLQENNQPYVKLNKVEMCAAQI